MADRDEDDARRRRSLIALAAIALLFLVGWVLARELYAEQKLEDCLLSRRTNCQPIETPAR